MSTTPVCPRCGGLLAASSAAAGFACGACRGAFLSRQGMDEALQAALASQGREAGAPAPPLTCPGCGSPMRALKAGSATLDRCDSCGGVWLDAGESLAELGAGAGKAPAAAALSKFLIYGLSLPERTVRSTVALAAGTASEAAKLLVPQAFQDSKTYEILVRNSLRFLTHDIGGAQSRSQDAAMEGTEYMARKAVGNFVDMAGLLTLHMSPLWILAAFSDIAYGSKTYLRELAEELKREGVIDEGSTIARTDDLLEAVQNASGRAAGLLDTPPLSVGQLKQSLSEIRQAVGSADYASVLPQQELSRYWEEMRQISRREGVSLFEVSTAMTLHSLGKLGTITKGAWTSLRVASGMLNRTILSHYAQALSTLREKGFYGTISESYGPYVEAVWLNFAEERKTLTEELLTGRLLQSGLEKLRGWLRPGPKGGRAAGKESSG